MATASTTNNLSNFPPNGQNNYLKNAGNVPVVSVNTALNNFPWPTTQPAGDNNSVGGRASSSTSPASDNQQWEADEEEIIKRRIYELKRQFHNGRYLIITNMPRDTTEQVINA